MRTTLIAALVMGPAFGQPAPDPPAFDAASVKLNTSGSHHSSSRVTNGEVFMRNVSLRDCIEQAYHLNHRRLAAPDWLSTVSFDIVAKPASGTPRTNIA